MRIKDYWTMSLLLNGIVEGFSFYWSSSYIFFLFRKNHIFEFRIPNFKFHNTITYLLFLLVSQLAATFCSAYLYYVKYVNIYMYLFETGKCQTLCVFYRWTHILLLYIRKRANEPFQRHVYSQIVFQISDNTVMGNRPNCFPNKMANKSYGNKIKTKKRKEREREREKILLSRGFLDVWK